MRTIFNLLLFTLVAFTPLLKAQNLVSNPSLETLINCPTEISEVQAAQNWTQTTNGTSDLFNVCANGNVSPAGYVIGVPNNFNGSQNAFAGNSYAGFYTYVEGNDYKEYVQSQLLQPLTVGQTYCFRFNISLAGRSSFATNGIGALFTIDDLSQDPNYGIISNFFSTLPFTPQFLSTQIVTDSTNWVEIGGTFTATQPFQYVVIGCFLDSASIVAQPFTSNNPSFETPNMCYYYFDEIVVEQVTPNGQLTVTATPQNVCLGQSVTLTATGNTPGVPIEWNTGQTGASITYTPNALGAETISASSGTACSAFTGQANINVIDCSGGQLSLTITEDTICRGETTTLTVTGGTNYNWSTGATNVDVINVSPQTTTNYTVTGTVGGNTQTLAATVTVLSIDAQASYTPADENTVDFTSGMPASYTGPFFWSFGDDITSTEENPTHTYPAPGTYNAYLAVVNAQNCVDTLFFTVVVGGLNTLYVPNAFTPDNDGLNDQFIHKGSFTESELMIYNRWGELVFLSQNPSIGWDGTARGEFCPSGVYTYKLNVKYPNNLEDIRIGKVVLLK